MSSSKPGFIHNIGTTMSDNCSRKFTAESNFWSLITPFEFYNKFTVYFDMNFVPRFDDINIVPAKLRQISVDKK
jgi:hypothetical protein